MSPRAALRRLSDRVFGTRFERMLAKAAADPRPDIVFGWNRGLGDIALGLQPLFLRIRRVKPQARIVVVTRGELREGFLLTEADEVLAVEDLARGAPLDVRAVARARGLDLARAAAVFEDPDPDRWIRRHRREWTARLHWRAEFDARAERFRDELKDASFVGVHLSSETAQFYGYAKDWPLAHWERLFTLLSAREPVRFIVFGHRPEPPLARPDVVDLRGRTGVLEMLAVIRSHCKVLIAPDSGVLSLVYYLDAPRALTLISLWSDPDQGVLKQGVASPNPLLVHRPLTGRNGNVANITPEEVFQAVMSSPAERRAA